MFSMCSELTPRARIPDTRIPQLMQPCLLNTMFFWADIFKAVAMEDGLPMLENRESCRLRKVPVTLEPCKQRRNHWKARSNYL